LSRVSSPVARGHDAIQLYLAALIIPLAMAFALIFLTDATFGVPLLFNTPGLAVFYLVLVPIVEESAFRGFLQGFLSSFVPFRGRYFLWLSLPNLITSAAFTAVHFMHYDGFLPAATFIPSLVFGFFKDKTGSILPSVGLHILYNLGFNSLYF
jgi:membrane protease YdiL (CAAX protease family)